MNKENNRIYDVTLVLAAMKLEAIRAILCTRTIHDFTILQWNDPDSIQPEEGSYVVIKEKTSELGIFCVGAAYEHGEFWYTEPEASGPIPKEKVIGWSYGPYDDRLDPLGRMIL